MESLVISADVLEDAEIDDGSVSHVVVIRKLAGRQLAADKLRNQIDTIIASVNTAQRKLRGWSVDVRNDDTPWRMEWIPARGNGSGRYAYDADLTVECHPDRKRRTIDAEFDNLMGSIASRGRMFSGEDWKVVAVDDKAYVAKSVEDQPDDIASEVGYAPLIMPADFWDHFSDLYGLEDQIQLLKDAVQAAMDSDFRNRFNCVLIGPPGCGKSNICQLFKKAFGEESVLEFDGTSTTMAGAQKELSEREELPRILLIEEIEKAPEASLQWLLSLTDIRAEIRKTTARGNMMRDVKMLAICTINDYETFARLASGALKSRFPNEIGFARPTRAVRRRILEREISRVKGGNEAWIEPAIKFAEELGTNDPRELIAICLCGRDDLLTDEYQRRRRATRPGVVRVVDEPAQPKIEDFAF